MSCIFFFLSRQTSSYTCHKICYESSDVYAKQRDTNQIEFFHCKMPSCHKHMSSVVLTMEDTFRSTDRPTVLPDVLKFMHM